MNTRLLTFLVLAVVLVGGGVYYYRSHNAVDAPAPVTAAVTRGDVIAKIGQTHARALFLTGERFDAERAQRIGLVHRVVDTIEALDAAVYETVTQLKTSGPEAVRECKKLIAYVAAHDLIDAVPYTIEAIANRRVSDEGQEGMQAFLDKGLASWVSKN